MADTAERAYFWPIFKHDFGPRLAVVVSLCLVFLAAVSALVLVRGVEQQLDNVVQTYEVRNEARELTIALSEAESSQRGYLLTADATYLEPYRKAIGGIDARVNKLLELTQSDANQHQRIRSIVGEVQQKTAEMARTIELVSSDRAQDAQSLTETGMGNRLMDGLRQTLGRFIAEEDQNLLDRNRLIDQSRRWLVGAVLVALAGAVVLAFSLFHRTQQQVFALSANQNVLRNQNEVLEERVRERTLELEESRAHALKERERVEILLRDANHRIGNSLSTVSSLLGLQLMRSDSAEVQDALEAARSRVHAVASAHRRLRLGEDLETTQADEFLAAVVEDLAETATSMGNVAIKGEFEPVVINARDATTIGIIVGELVTNALKHGFDEGMAGNVTVRLRNNPDGIPELSVEDDGRGFSNGTQPGEGGLGTLIIQQLASQFGGAPRYEKRAVGGMMVTLSLPGLGPSRTT